MINLKLLNRGLRGVLTPSEFMTLYVIESALGTNNEPKKIYYDMIADLIDKTPRQVKRLVDALVEKEFIFRTTIQKTKTKKESFYSLNLDKIDTKITQIDDKNVILNNIKQLKNNLKPSITHENDDVTEFEEWLRN